MSELSDGLTEDDMIHVPNIPLISAIPNVVRLGFFAKIALNSIVSLTKPNQFEMLSVRDYLFGHTDDFMNAISKIKWDFSGADIGILAPRRGVTRNTMTINSGIENTDDVGKVLAIDNQEKTNIWKSDGCNNIKGKSDGVFYGPSLVKNKQSTDVYLPDLCRSLPLEFKRKVKKYEDIFIKFLMCFFLKLLKSNLINFNNLIHLFF